eukprot:9026032-Heterocapsa_arctica.AAC.1
MDLVVVGVNGEDFAIPPCTNPVEGSVAEHHPYTFRFLGVAVTPDLQKEGVPLAFRAHGGAAV